jgi:PAS domain S-box-containing protein
MSLALETEILLELALAIGESTDLHPMLERVLVTMIRLLGGSGAKVVRIETDADGALRPEVVARVPRTFNQHPRYRAFHAAWSFEALVAQLATHDDGRPLEMPVDGGAVYAFPLPGFGLLIFARHHGTLSPALQRAFAPLARKLATSARACLFEQELRREGQRLELAARTAGLGVWEWVPDTGALVCDPQMLALLGLAPEAFGGTIEDWARCLHPDDLAAARASLRAAVRTGDQFASGFRVVRGDGEIRHLQGHAAVQRDADGRVGRVVGVTIDVTARTRAEEAMRRAREAAEQANRAKSQFIANVSHELRTPMNGILGMTALLLAGDCTPAQREQLAIVQRSGEALLAILNDVLDFSKIEAGHFGIEVIPFPLRDALREPLAPLAVRAAAKGLAFDVAIDPTLPDEVLGDPVRLRQVLVNLVDNALKFTAQGAVRVEARPLAGRDDGRAWISLAVHDTGVGIAPDAQQEIFEAFRQADASTTRRFGGTGLGLSICRRLVELMGGTITLTSTPGTGSTFGVELPLGRPAPTAAVHTAAPDRGGAASSPHRGDTPAPRAASAAALRILLVEDNPVNQLVAAGMLRQMGHVVEIADDGARAIECFAPGRYDLVFMDMQMPVLDGLAAARAIREIEGQGPRTPIVAMTANAMAADRAQCLAVGMDDHLAKPIRQELLRDVLAQWVPDASVVAGQAAGVAHADSATAV